MKKGTVPAFSLHPPPRNSNVIISAFGGIDMVFVPRMELLTTDETDQGEIAWNAAITAKEAHRALELKFYKFSEINCYRLMRQLHKRKQPIVRSMQSWSGGV